LDLREDLAGAHVFILLEERVTVVREDGRTVVSVAYDDLVDLLRAAYEAGKATDPAAPSSPSASRWSA
jgi:hypothetical protein